MTLSTIDWDGQPDTNTLVQTRSNPKRSVHALQSATDTGKLRIALASLATRSETIRQSAADLAEEIAHLVSNDGSPDGVSCAAGVPRWHFPMLHDDVRNGAFASAISRNIRPGDHVLDIGSGTGLLAMLAVEAGAAHVTTCEGNPVLAELSQQIVNANGFGDVIRVVPKMSHDVIVGVDMPRPADLIVSEIVDCGLIGEGVLSTIDHARRNLLADGGRMLPSIGEIHGALVDSSAIDRLNRAGQVAGFDLELLNVTSTRGHFPVRLETWPHQLLSDSTEIMTFDFALDDLSDGSAVITFPATEIGSAIGVVAWFRLDLDGEILTNEPRTGESHWMQAMVPFARHDDVATGDMVTVSVNWSGAKLFAEVLDVASATLADLS